MKIISLIISFIGIASWCYIWASCRYNTSKNILTQIGMIFIGVAWLSLFITATSTQDVAPLSIILFRLFLLVGFLLLSPLLKHEGQHGNKR